MSAGALGIDHIAIPAADARASYSFYHDVLGLPLVDAMSGDDWGGKPWLMMLFRLRDGRQLALCALQGLKPAERAGEEPEDLRHFAFAVDSPREQLEWKDKLRRHGIPFEEEDHGRQHSLYFKDPNGVVLEITTPPTPGIGEVNAQAQDVVSAWISKFGTQNKEA